MISLIIANSSTNLGCTEALFTEPCSEQNYQDAAPSDTKIAVHRAFESQSIASSLPFPLDTQSIVGLQSSPSLDQDEFISLAMDKKRYREEISTIQQKSLMRRSLLPSPPKPPNESKDTQASENIEYSANLLSYTPLAFRKIARLCFSSDCIAGGMDLVEKPPTKCSGLTKTIGEISSCQVEAQEGSHSSLLTEQYLFKESLEQMNKLDKLPENEILTTPTGMYLNPKVTLLQINIFLGSHLARLDYAGVSISMATNQIYDVSYPDRSFTAIYFKRNEKSLLKTFLYQGKKVSENFIDYKPSEKTWKRNKKELEDCISLIFKQWGYDSFRIGNVNSDFFPDKETKSSYELYLLLFYKRIYHSDTY